VALRETMFWLYLAAVSRYHSYLNSAVQILAQYRGEEPFASFLKKYFSANKRYGSKDRKQVSHLCYCYFRLGKSLMELPVEERILVALFLCTTEEQETLKELKPEWNKYVTVSLEEKWSMFDDQYALPGVFPWKKELSESIDHRQMERSFFIQPDLFLRLRPGKEASVKKKLQEAAIPFTVVADNCIALANASKIDEVIQLNKEAVIQDYNSQRVGELMRLTGTVRRVWDCCAASGGKSIMAYDLLPGIELTVSDVRASILANLKKRFDEAGIKKYKSLVLDLAKENVQYSTLNPDSYREQFSLVIADVPCTGSGTWSRTPEQLFYFDEKKIEEYVALQRKIVRNVIPHIEKGGYLLYITCSVFKKENEEAIAFVEQQFQLEIKRMEIFEGYDKKADTLFAALLRVEKK
jgi:16S rRNA (cytosine967-C5)-methyltransferase